MSFLKFGRIVDRRAVGLDIPGTDVRMGEMARAGR